MHNEDEDEDEFAMIKNNLIAKIRWMKKHSSNRTGW